ncbi:hypothetical protein [Hungatella sp.]|mgnify:CR=1 FL=1|jgi:hypothetical protein|nr:hypothetical protein [Hungatella sp.]
MIDAMDILTLYSSGVAAGIVLSVIPYIIGCVISLAIKIMKGGS